MRRIYTNTFLTFPLLAALAACSSQDDANSASGLNAPTDFKVEALEGAAHLTWHDNSDEAEFMIQRKSGAGDWMTIAMVPFDTTQYHDADLDPSMTYTYRVMPMSKSGEHGPASSEASCMPKAGGAHHMAGSGS